MGSKVDLAGGWAKLWASMSASGAGPLLDTAVIIGVALLVIAVLTYIWEKRRGGANATKVMWTAILAAAMSAPVALFPAVFTMFDFVLNTLLGVLSALG